ncbi:sterol desaturase family protein [Algivirga pacifica]|uniref:Sterol desaturase family protein n=1 Tax=Algivirga pacifica TaxID=1162670 RepID=A0ABP9DKW6_9BACT
MSFVLANGMLLLLVLLEACFVQWVKKEQIPWKEVIFNLNSGHILMWVLRGVEISVYHMVTDYASLQMTADWPYWATFLLCFVAWDFGFYWLHRFHHKIKLLWAIHVVHHEGEHFSLSLGIRNSWYSSLSSIPFFLLLAVIGIPTEVFLLVSSIHYSVQFYNHNSIVRNSGVLDTFLVTPKHHKVHHGKNPQYIDKNFGGTLLLWDKLFGTFQKEDEEVQCGVKDYKPSYDVLWANNLPFLRLLSLSWKKVMPPRGRDHFPDSLIALGGVLLFLLLLAYIHIENVWMPLPKFIFFLIIFLSTLSCGFLSEGRRVGVGIWSLCMFVLWPITLFYFDIHDWWMWVLLLLSMTYGVFLFIFKSKVSKQNVNV